MATPALRRHPEPPWLVVGGIVLVLALIDRICINQSSPFAHALDWATILSAAIGSGYSWITSYRVPLRTVLVPSAGLTIRIFLCWLLGPVLVVGAVFPARNIDGGLLLVYPPFLGLLLAICVFPFLIIKRRRQFRMTERESSAR